MKLLFVRHGPAEDREAWAALGKSDALRPLTAEGTRKVRAAFKGLGLLVPALDSIATSPLTRAAATADELARFHPRAIRIVLDSLKPGGGAAGLLGELRGRLTGPVAALVGHEPSLGEAASAFLREGAGSFLTFKKGAAALVSFPGEPELGGGALEWLLQPKVLRRL